MAENRMLTFANKNGLKLKLPSKQNYYPDLTFEDSDGHLFAVDLNQVTTLLSQ